LRLFFALIFALCKTYGVDKRCIQPDTIMPLYLSRGLSTKIVVAKPLTAVDNFPSIVG